MKKLLVLALMMCMGCAVQIGVGNRNVSSDGKQIKGIESTLEDALNLKDTSLGNANQAEIGKKEKTKTTIKGDVINEKDANNDNDSGSLLDSVKSGLGL